MDLNLNIKASGEGTSASFVRETETTEGFERDVLQRSSKKPVIVDFWAPWCGPCKQLTPLLEKAVTAMGGAVEMVKVNVDKNPELAQALQVQSVPMVYAFFQGHPVDGFMGARPESEIKAFVAKLQKLGGSVPAEGQEGGAASQEQIKKIMEEGDAFVSAGNFSGAMEKYSAVLEEKPDHSGALAGIGMCLLSQGNAESVAEMLSQLAPEQLKDAAFKGLLWFKERMDGIGEVLPAVALEEKLGKNAKDHAARYDLARYKLAGADIAGAIAGLIEITRLNREWEEQKARKLLLEIFEALPPRHPLTAQGRRRLSALLFA